LWINDKHLHERMLIRPTSFSQSAPALLGADSTPLWPVLAVFAVALTWQFSDHYPPWFTFLNELWVAMLALAFFLPVILTAQQRPLQVPVVSLLLLGLAMIVWAQWALGMLPFSGQAVVSSGYLLLMTLCVCMGFQLQHRYKARALAVLFGGLLLSAILSVGVIYYQHLHLYDFSNTAIDIYIVNSGTLRPAANIAQPNQAATLLIWGLLAGAWLHQTKRLTTISLAFLGIFLTSGLVLTNSRIGLLELLAIALLAWMQRDRFPKKHLAYVLIALALFALAATVLLPTINAALFLAEPTRTFEELFTESIRQKAYKMFFGALIQQPWLGFGLTNFYIPQFLMAEHTASFHGYFIQSHNILLDFLLWFGIPLGGALIFITLRWFWTTYTHLQHHDDVLMLLCVVALMMHAMVELPHQYLFFILPAAVFVGLLTRGKGMPVGKPSLMIVYVAVVAGFCVVCLDYFKTEASFRNLRIENSKLDIKVDTRVPDLISLNQMEGLLTMTKQQATVGMTPAQLKQMERVVNSHSAPYLIFAYINALALNGRPEEAKVWMKRYEMVAPISLIENAKKLWRINQQRQPLLLKVDWL
jgi:O-antigen ligase